MASNVETLTQAAAGLSPAQKLSLANHLLAEVEASDPVKNDAAWEAVIRERRSRYEAGEIKTYSVEEVFAEVDRRLKEKR